MTPRSVHISLIASLGACLAWSQVLLGPESAIEPYFKALLSGQAKRADQSGARLETAMKVASPADIAAALPLIFSALSSADGDVRTEGAGGLLDVGRRPDGVALLTPGLPKIYEMIGNPKLNQLAIPVLDELRPAPPEALRVVAEYMGRLGPSDPVQPLVAQVLIRNAHGDDQILDAILQFASQPLNEFVRYRLLDIITFWFKGNERLIRVLEAALSDPNPAIRARGIHDLSQLGRDVMSPYTLDLQRIAADSNEPRKVKDEADLALRVLAGSSLPPDH
jgi:hypothetical protein